jgi:flagellar motor switch protein FliM
VSLGKDQIDQDALAAEWGLALEADAATAQQDGASEGGEGAEAAASQWQAMVDDGGQFIQSAKGGAERILNQDEIDSLLGFSLADISRNDNSGSARSSTRRWSPTNGCRCWRSSSTGWSG